MSERSSPRSSIFGDLSTPGTSFVLPEESHASSSRAATTEEDLESMRSEIPDATFSGLVEGLSQADHVNTLDDLATYANVSVASLQRLLSERPGSNGSTTFQLTSLGETYVSRFASTEQRFDLSRASAIRSEQSSRIVDQLRGAQSSQSDMPDRLGSSRPLNRRPF
jgi:hypothetical protein